MRIFVSHASEQHAEADRLAIALRARRHTVFLDADDLPPGSDYQSRIQQAIEGSDLFCFLISPQSVTQGRYTLSELGLARKCWPDPTGRIVPIMVVKVSVDVVPGYLRAVSILEPQGDFVADSLAAIEALRPRPFWRSRSAFVVAGVVLLAVAAIFAYLRGSFRQSGNTSSSVEAPTQPQAGESSGLRIRVTETMQETVKGFAAHLRGVGLRNVNDGVTVYFYSEQMPLPVELRQRSDTINAFYYDKTLYLNWSLSADKSVLLREYTHYVLAQSADTDAMGSSDVESGVADYLPASYLGKPVIGEGLGHLFNLPTTYIRRLDRFASYNEVQNEPHARGEVWSGAMWACRQALGQKPTDEAVVSAWTSAMRGPRRPDASTRFGSALAKMPGPVGTCLLREIERRQLPH